MSDLNDFFAKKDRKKKKAAAKSAAATISSDTTQNSNGTENEPTTTQSNDGWIEIDDPRGTQVNTGGRTVGEFRRNSDENETNNEGTVNIEKFSGWAKSQPEETGGEENEQQTTQSSSTAFPSLADAVKIQKVPVSYSKAAAVPASGSGQPSAAGRPRFINTDKEKLRRKLAEREAAISKP